MPLQNRHFSSHMYPKSTYAPPSTPPNMVQPSSQTPSAPVGIPPYYLGRPLPQGAFYDNGMLPSPPQMQPRAAQPQAPSNGYNTPNFNNYATAGGRMAPGLGYNDPVVGMYMAQQQRNALTPQQRAYVDATRRVMANRMAGEIPAGPRSDAEALRNNVTGPSTGKAYSDAAQRQAARAAQYKALVAHRYGRPMPAAAPQQSGMPQQVSISYGPNGLTQTPISSTALPPSPSGLNTAQNIPGLNTVPNPVYPQGIHNMPSHQPYYAPQTPLQRATSSAFNSASAASMPNHAASNALAPLGGSLGNMLYGNPPVWNPTLPSQPASPAVPQHAKNLNSYRWPSRTP